MIPFELPHEHVYIRSRGIGIWVTPGLAEGFFFDRTEHCGLCTQDTRTGFRLCYR